MDGQTSQQHLLRDQVDQMASRGTSRPDEMSSAMDKLHGLEDEARQLLDMNQKYVLFFNIFILYMGHSVNNE